MVSLTVERPVRSICRLKAGPLVAPVKGCAPEKTMGNIHLVLDLVRICSSVV